MSTARCLCLLGLILASSACTEKMPKLLPPVFSDNFDRTELGPSWKSTAPPGTYRIENGELVVSGGKNHPLWLVPALPRDAVIELDAYSKSPDGDIKVEAFGDGQSFAKTVSYTATSYVFIQGGWQNRLAALCRMDEHADDRKTRGDLKVVPGQRYHWLIARKDQLVRFYIDGKLALEMDDLVPLEGPGHSFFGFNNWEAEVHFDNLVVRPY
ncbi:MAG TPA: hypothetical protein PK472_08705 [Pseudomonadota bacterium]|nr:hypothetical protein [Pseudomonadota bacterium]